MSGGVDGYASDGAKKDGRWLIIDDIEHDKPTLRHRFWRWVIGNPLPRPSRPAPTLNMLEKAKMKEDEMIQGARRFQIIDAVNGKIIRYTGQRDMEDRAVNAARGTHVPYGEYYYLVKEGEDLLGAIARILVVDKITS